MITFVGVFTWVSPRGIIWTHQVSHFLDTLGRSQSHLALIELKTLVMSWSDHNDRK